jgi:DeoR/GlpR family transcriptional regulator of sugar metabolism
MLKEERLEVILKELKASNLVLLEPMAKNLGVSEDTVRRDIEQLSKSGLLIKVRGGAISPAKNPLSFSDREGFFAEGKNIIALKSLQLLKNARTVFMDGGTTTQALVANLPADSAFRVITNNIALIPVLSTYSRIEIIVLGGQYDRVTQTNVGQQACDEAAMYQADIYLMGVCAVHSEVGITAALREDGEVKKALMRSSRKTAILSNFEKLETTDFFKVCSLDAIDTLVTDLQSDDKRLDPFRNFDIEIL